MSALIVAAVLLGFGMGSLFHGLTERDWLSTRVGAALTAASSLVAVIAGAVMEVSE